MQLPLGHGEFLRGVESFTRWDNELGRAVRFAYVGEYLRIYHLFSLFGVQKVVPFNTKKGISKAAPPPNSRRHVTTPPPFVRV